MYAPNKKYVDNTEHFQLLDTFNNKLIEFSNSYFDKKDAKAAYACRSYCASTNAAKSKG